MSTKNTNNKPSQEIETAFEDWYALQIQSNDHFSLYAVIRQDARDAFIAGYNLALASKKSEDTFIKGYEQALSDIKVTVTNKILAKKTRPELDTCSNVDVYPGDPLVPEKISEDDIF